MTDPKRLEDLFTEAQRRHDARIRILDFFIGLGTLACIGATIALFFL